MSYRNVEALDAAAAARMEARLADLRPTLAGMTDDDVVVLAFGALREMAMRHGVPGMAAWARVQVDRFELADSDPTGHA